jgi:DNA primase
MVRRTVARHDLATIEDRSAAVAEALPMLEHLSDPVRRSEYAGLLADLAGVAETSVLESLRRRLGGRPQEVAKTVRKGTASERLEREMLRLLARDPETFATLAPRLTEGHFRSSSARRLFNALVGANGDVGALAGGEDPKLAGAAAALAVEPLEGEPTPEYAEAVWMRLQEFALKARSDEMRARLQKLNPTTDPGYDDLFLELVEVDGELRRLRDAAAGAVS